MVPKFAPPVVVPGAGIVKILTTTCGEGKLRHFVQRYDMMSGQVTERKEVEFQEGLDAMCERE